MTLHGKRDDFTLGDFRACAKTAAMKRGRADAIVEEVRATVSRWREFAEQAGVPEVWRPQVQENLRLEWPG